MDFWAQHKDFVLKVLAGFGVFLVALIARSITYGDELEDSAKRNRSLAGNIARIKLVDSATRRKIAASRDALLRNVESMTKEFTWDGRNDRLEIDLVRRTLSYLARYGRAGDAARAAAADWESIRGNLNGGFSQLRLKVRDALVEEAAERNIEIRNGIGFQTVLQIQPEDLLKYLMQLELAARLVRSCIDANVIAIDEIRIDTQRQRRPVLPGANPDLLEEYPVTIRFHAGQAAAIQVLNAIGRGGPDQPQPPVRGLLVDRLKRPPNTVGVELSVLATAVDPSVPFKVEEKKDR